MATRKPLVIIDGDVQEIPSGDTTAQAPATGPAGSNAEVQYNDSTVLAGDSSFTWDDTNKNLNVSSQSDGIRINSNKVWHAGNDGASSGLDADTIDTLHASSFVRTDADTSVDGYDLTYSDTSSTKGVVTARKQVSTTTVEAQGSAGTAPSGGGVVAMGSSAGTADLTFHNNSGTKTGFVQTDPSNTRIIIGQEQNNASLIFRNKTGAGAAQDNTVWHSTNDGANSGLDADLLDGEEGSYYQQASSALTTSTTFGGDVSGTYNAIVIDDDSHNHIIGNVDGLQTALDAKAPTASPTFTGTVSGVTKTHVGLSNVTNDAQVPASGGSFTGNVSFGDNDKAQFGAGNDLQIYHDGYDSYIKDAGTGNLRLEGENIYLLSTSGEVKLRADSNSFVKLYYDNSEKLATTSTGIDVTGTVTADGLTVDNWSIDGNYLSGVSTNVGINTDFHFRIDIDNDNNQTDRQFYVTANNGAKTLLNVQESGDISFYEDTGTTAKFFWDASAESLGIGTTSPAVELEVEGSGTTSGTVRASYDSVYYTDYSVNSIKAYREASTAGNFHFGMDSSDGSAWSSTGGNITFYTNDSGDYEEKVRIDTNGNVGIGTTSPASGKKLHVNGDTRIDGNIALVGNSGTISPNDSGAGYMKIFGGGTNEGGAIEFRGGGNSGDLRFLTGTSGAGTERMRITSAGNVGIGTGDLTIGNYSAGRTLTFEGNQNATHYIRFNDNNSTEGTYIKSVGQSSGGTIYMGSRWNTDTDKFTFNTVTGNLVTNGPITSTGQFLGRKVITYDDVRDTDPTYYKILLPATYSDVENGGHVKLTMIWRGTHASSSATKTIEFSYGTHHGRSADGYLTLSSYTLIHDSETENSYGSYDITPGFALYRGVVEDSNGDCGAILKVTGRHSSHNKRFHLRAEITGDTKRATTITDMGSSLESGAVAVTRRDFDSLIIDTTKLEQGSATRNFKIQPTVSGGDVGISLYTGDGNWGAQLYGTSGAYGFLNANWSSWDLRKVPNGDLFFNNNNSNKAWHAGNDGSGSGLDADTLDGQHGSYYLPKSGGTLTGVVYTDGGSYFEPLDTGGNSGMTGTYSYGWGYQEGGAWSNPYPDLVIGYHTGMKFGGYTSYGGCRFYADHPSRTTTELFSIGNGDSHVRVANNLYVGGNIAWHAGNDGSGSGLDADTLDGISSSSLWRQMGGDSRYNYTLNFRPPSSYTGTYAGLQFVKKSDGNNAGYLLIRSDSDALPAYTSDGITLTADAGWLTLAQRYGSSKGIRFVTDPSSGAAERMTISGNGDISFNSNNKWVSNDTYGATQELRAKNGSLKGFIHTGYVSGVNYSSWRDVISFTLSNHAGVWFQIYTGVNDVCCNSATAGYALGTITGGGSYVSGSVRQTYNHGSAGHTFNVSNGSTGKIQIKQATGNTSSTWYMVIVHGGGFSAYTFPNDS